MSEPLTAPKLTMTDGHAIPLLGLGTWPMRDAEARRAVREALNNGYRLIDTAEAYENEEAVGEGIRTSRVPRDQVFLTTKFNREWHSRAGVRQACEASLRRLKMEYIDLYLIHWPNPKQDRYVEAFEGMMELIEAGLIRSAGVSNFKPAHLQRLFAAGFFPQLNQIQLDPFRPRLEDVAFHRQHGIVVETWSPLDRDGSLLKEPVVLSLARELNKTPGQVVLRWHVQKGYVTVPKSANPQRQSENLHLFDFVLSPEQVAQLDGLARTDAEIVDSDVFGH
ncbi:MAG: aldo/keto reductase [Edaphobacter sp.]|uniref:aldo/keto reductase n=1 Tax=Edaphobacter sp. TaxID=1934404 RepID=UPI002392CDA3|nr:aldo/keto reductase [Edaphobacter sp.]MDE1178283.1 aldo/keto reductase [Edaphobacter sp.]